MMNRLWLFMPLLPLLLPLAACQNNSLTRFLNGGAATSATTATTEASDLRKDYVTGNTVDQASLNHLRQFAPGQTTQEVHSVIGFPDSYTTTADYYWTATGGMIAVLYDSSGKWTGEIVTVKAPQWVASPYPGSRK